MDLHDRLIKSSVGDIVRFKAVNLRYSPKNVYKVLSSNAGFHNVFNGSEQNFADGWTELQLVETNALVLDTHEYIVAGHVEHQPYYLILLNENRYWVHGVHINAT